MRDSQSGIYGSIVNGIIHDERFSFSVVRSCHVPDSQGGSQTSKMSNLHSMLNYHCMLFSC